MKNDFEKANDILGYIVEYAMCYPNVSQFEGIFDDDIDVRVERYNDRDPNNFIIILEYNNEKYKLVLNIKDLEKIS